jgi:predicted dehydrogenase
MIRLAVGGVNEASRQEVAARLRGVVVEPAPEACDAVALIDLTRPEEAPIEGFLAAGKHVLLTAEPWLSAELIQRWSSAARDGAQLAVVNPDRYLPSRQLIKEQRDRNLGEPGLLRLHRWEPPAADSASHSRGAVLLRDLDLTVWLMGSLPNVVYATLEQAHPAVVVHLGFPGGGMALIDHARLPPGDGYCSLCVIGSAGAAYADDHQNIQLVYQGGHPRAVRTDEGVKALVALVQDFALGLGASRDLAASVAAWRDVLAVCDALGRSLAARRAIHLEGR